MRTAAAVWLLAWSVLIVTGGGANRDPKAGLLNVSVGAVNLLAVLYLAGWLS